MLEIAKLALDDKQLHVSGTRELDGQKVTIYELNYTSRDMVYFYSLNDEIVFYSNYHQPLPTKDIRTKFFKESSDEVSEKDLHTIFSFGTTSVFSWFPEPSVHWFNFLLYVRKEGYFFRHDPAQFVFPVKFVLLHSICAPRVGVFFLDVVQHRLLGCEGGFRRGAPVTN
jgi:hypothetical protein